MKKIILTAEDEEAIRESLLMLLQDEGYDCFAVSDGLDALQLLENDEVSIGLLITDLQMPRLSGLELIRRVREIQPKLGILVVTAYSNADLVQEALKLGADDYLYKPVNFDELLQKTEELSKKEYSM